MTPVDEAIITMVRSLAQNQDLRNTVTQVLDVQMNHRKAFCVWFISEAMAIPEHWWGIFKRQAIQLLQHVEYYQPGQMPPPVMASALPFDHPQQQAPLQQQAPPQHQPLPQQQPPSQQQAGRYGVNFQ